MSDSIVAFFICLLMFAFANAILEESQEYYRETPLKPVRPPKIEKKPQDEDLYRRQCPTDIGHLQEYFDCVDTIRERMVRTDI